MNDSPNPNDARLDALLQSWSHDQAADAATLDRLHRAISGSVAVPQRPASLRPASLRPAGAIMAVCVAAASLMVAMVAGFNISNRTLVPAPIVADQGPGPRTRLAALWNETDRLFGRNLEWLCDLDGELLLGVNSASPSSMPSDRVCLSLTLRVFDPAKQVWVTSWNGRISCRGGSTVDFASADKRSTGSIWVQSRPDGRFAVSHWLSWRDHPDLSGPIDATVASDQPQVVAEGVEDGHRIQIVQQVWRPDVG